VIALIVLLAATLSPQPKIETFAAPKGHLPTEIARAGDGMVFVSWTNWPALEPHLNTVTAKGKISTKALEKDHLPGLFAHASDGTLWISDARRGVLWHVLADGTTERVDIDQPTLDIAVDTAGLLWATHAGSTHISRYSADGAKTAELDTGRGRFKLTPPKPSKTPSGMTPAGALRSQRETRRDVTPAWIVIDADNALWFSDPTMRSVGVVTSDGHQQRYKLPLEWNGTPGPLVVSNGQAWFTVAKKPILGQMSTDGFFDSVDIGAPADAIAKDDKGRIWFATSVDLGYLDAEGIVHHVALPKGERVIRSIAAGADGAIWFVDQKSKTIGRVLLP
jgi:streptogramin lyase